MTLRIARAVAVLMAPLSVPGPVLAGSDPIAQIVCAPRDEMLVRLQQGFGAELRGLGMRSQEAVIEVWADRDGDWTLVQNWSTGQSCILAMGEGWEGIEPPPA